MIAFPECVDDIDGLSEPCVENRRQMKPGWRLIKSEQAVKRAQKTIETPVEN
jgi:hypothetical protein